MGPVCWRCCCCFAVRQRRVFALLAATTPFKCSWGPIPNPLSPITKVHEVLQERCSLFQSGVGGLSGWLEEFKVFREPTKDFLQLSAVWQAAETPLVSTAKHCCPCVLEGMRQNSGIPQLHMLAMCAGGSGLQPLQTF